MSSTAQNLYKFKTEREKKGWGKWVVGGWGVGGCALKINSDVNMKHSGKRPSDPK